MIDSLIELQFATRAADKAATMYRMENEIAADNVSDWIEVIILKPQHRHRWWQQTRQSNFRTFHLWSHVWLLKENSGGRLIFSCSITSVRQLLNARVRSAEEAEEEICFFRIVFHRTHLTFYIWTTWTRSHSTTEFNAKRRRDENSCFQLFGTERLSTLGLLFVKTTRTRATRSQNGSSRTEKKKKKTIFQWKLYGVARRMNEEALLQLK